MNNIGGTRNLPKSGDVNQKEDGEDWVDAQLHRIGAPSLSDNLRNYSENITTAARTAADLAKREGREISQEDIRALPEIQQNRNRILSLYPDPAKGLAVADEYVNSALAPYAPKMKGIQEGIAQISYDEAKEARDASRTLDQIASQVEAPPTARQPSGVSPREGGGYSSITSRTGPPAAQPIPEAAKTPGERAADALDPRDTTRFFGKSVNVPPEFYKQYGQPKTVYVTKGDETFTVNEVTTAGGRTLLLRPGTNQVFNREMAMKEGWQFDAVRPVRINPPAPSYHMGPSKDGRRMVWWAADRSTGKWNRVADKDGHEIQAKLDKPMADEAFKAFKVADTITAKRDAEIDRINMKYEADIADLHASVGKYASYTDKKSKASLEAQKQAVRDQAIATVKENAKTRLGLLGHQLGVQNMINQMAEEVGAGTQYDPNTAAGWLNQDHQEQ